LRRGGGGGGGGGGSGGSGGGGDGSSAVPPRPAQLMSRARPPLSMKTELVRLFAAAARPIQR